MALFPGQVTTGLAGRTLVSGAQRLSFKALFMISLASLFFPAITSVVMGTDMPPVWSVQGLFLFVILLVCGASYRIDRERATNLARADQCNLCTRHEWRDP